MTQLTNEQFIGYQGLLEVSVGQNYTVAETPMINSHKLGSLYMCINRSTETYLQSVKADPATGACPANNPVPCSRFTSPQNKICVQSEAEKATKCPITDIKLVEKGLADSFVIQNPYY